MTHRDVVRKASSWLRGREHCGAVAVEVVACVSSNEIADAIGWKNGHSVLVECKASRPDFLADREKISRRIPGVGLGDYRYYMAPKGTIKPEELTDGWGLVEIGENHTRVIVKAAYRNREIDAVRDEIRLLVSVLRRIQTREFVTIVPPTSDGPDGE
ncbi:MAG: hypothetical protein ABSC23_03650 [Bryobacteraceae bacterium]|jgi:hypothetical protein